MRKLYQTRGRHLGPTFAPDDKERDLITAYESGEFRPVKDQQEAKQTAIRAARRYMRKDARVNIRLSAADLEMPKVPP